MIIAIIILSIMLIVCCYVIWNLLRKIETVEDAYKQVSLTNITMYEAIQATVIEMHKIDEKGYFASDDEVGATFNLLKETLLATKELMDGGDDEQ